VDTAQALLDRRRRALKRKRSGFTKMVEGGLVAHGGVDLEGEQIADAAYVAVRGEDLLEDPVLS
jgi:hypothetical protein